MSAELIPGILTHSLNEYIARLTAVEQSSLSWVHIDVMDGQFVPNITVMPHEFMGVGTRLNLEAHLMTFQPERYYSDLAVARVQRVLIHRECYDSSEETATALHQASDYFSEVGLVFNPATPFEDATTFTCDCILQMGVIPGASGQAFLPEVLPRLSQLKKLLGERVLEVDGGVHEDNIAALLNEGVGRVVVSSRLFSGYTIKEQVNTFTHLLNQGGI